MKDNDFEEIIKERERVNEEIDRTEREGLKNVLKHFDRINDKLFTFNNILIGGFFLLARVDKSMSLFTILIPFANLFILIYIEYKMMERNRFDATITTQPFDKYKAQSDSITLTNLFSLISILSTASVTLFFLYYLLVM